jgi:hypothetical protein
MGGRHLSRGQALLEAIAAGAALPGCGGSSTSTSSVSANAITLAADVSSQSPGFRSVLSVQESLPGIGNLSMHGNGSFEGQNGSMTMTIAAPAAGAALGNGQLQIVIDRGTMYMKLPAALSSKLPGGKPWWSINLDQLGKTIGISSLSSLTNGPAASNPSTTLSYLRATADGSVEDLGRATIDGVVTTHYHAKVDLAKLPAAVPASARGAARQMVAALKKLSPVTTTFPIDAWVDSAHRVRQLSYSEPLSINGQTATVKMKMNFVSFGAQPAPSEPPASQTVNVLSLLGGKLQ